ncbi:hypothetical protein ACHWUR_00185 [Klebsiella pneumoniae]
MKALRNKPLNAEEREFLEDDLEQRAMSGLTGKMEDLSSLKIFKRKSMN